MVSDPASSIIPALTRYVDSSSNNESSIRRNGIESDGFSFSSAFSCCGSEGRWEEALELIEVMLKGGPKTRPNMIAYTAAITS